MNAVNKKHNEKDNEMVQLTKIILKQTARHSKESLTFQKSSKKLFLHWRANLADQNKHQPLKIDIRVTDLTVLSVWNTPLIDTCQHCSTSRANQALLLLANAGFQNRGVSWGPSRLSLSFCRGSRVEGSMSRARVPCRGSRVTFFFQFFFFGKGNNRCNQCH